METNNLESNKKPQRRYIPLSTRLSLLPALGMVAGGLLGILVDTCVIPVVQSYENTRITRDIRESEKNEEVQLHNLSRYHNDSFYFLTGTLGGALVGTGWAYAAQRVENRLLKEGKVKE